jgi:hypothetical protein
MLTRVVDPARGWWTALPTGSDRHSTYRRVSRDHLPPVPGRLLESLTWLGDIPAAADDDSILRPDQSVRALESDVVPWLVEQGIPNELLPDALRSLAANPSLLAGIRSPTWCCIELGDKVVPLADSTGGGWLVHWLADSQSVLSWLIHIAPDGQHRVVVSPAGLGFEAEPDPDEQYPIPDRPLEPADLAAPEVEQCADSLPEFLARLWLEGETWWAFQGEAPATTDVVEYARDWTLLNP